MDRDQLLRDFSPFVDIGEDQPRISENKAKITIGFVRNGRKIKLGLDRQLGAIKYTQDNSKEKVFRSISALLSSEHFANVKLWAKTQTDLLKGELKSKDLIPFNVRIDSDYVVNTVDKIDDILGAARQSEDAAEILLIDGPAGIGKTNMIELLALRRSESYNISQNKLILHIKSRGRVLSNLDDLMAFSLQTLRTSVTYDQLPILIRHGLIIAAIDGFDELGDPNGYGTAWAQLGELISSVRGEGTLILAGRDTFISKERLLKDVHSLRDGTDTVRSITLLPQTTKQATEWLLHHQWKEKDLQITSVSVLLEEGSFALRPVFLKLLSSIKPKDISKYHESFLASFLIKSIVSRETRLFGKKVTDTIPISDVENFVDTFLMDAAREMADMQVEALDGATLSWISEASLGDGYPSDIVGVVKNRAAVNALLVNDERPGYRSFVHTYIQNYFLSRVAIETISRDELPKFIRRNILGAEFLSTFVDIASEYSGSHPDIMHQFIERARAITQIYPHFDRGGRNIGALLLTTLPFIEADGNNYFQSFQVDESVIRGTAGQATLDSVVINQLDCRNADLTQLTFTDCSVVTIMAGDASRFSSSTPIPSRLIIEDGSELFDSDDIVSWLGSKGRSGYPSSISIVPINLRNHPVYSLLGRLCRIHQYWFKEDDDAIVIRRIIKDEHWPVLRRSLEIHGFIKIENRPASGTSAQFLHVRGAQRILKERADDAEVVEFFRTLSELIQ